MVSYGRADAVRRRLRMPGDTIPVYGDAMPSYAQLEFAHKTGYKWVLEDDGAIRRATPEDLKRLQFQMREMKRWVRSDPDLRNELMESLVEEELS